VAALKSEAGNDLLVIGSTELAAALLKHDLVDEIRLMIDPVMLGGGKRFFRDDGVCRRLALVTSEMTSTGAILATYTRSVAESAERPQRLPRPPARTYRHDRVAVMDVVGPGHSGRFGSQVSACKTRNAAAVHQPAVSRLTSGAPNAAVQETAVHRVDQLPASGLRSSPRLLL
jgi:hypothetical protein